MYAFPDSRRFAGALARALGAALSTLELHRFPDGESLVRASGRPARRAILVRSLDDPNAKLIELLLASDALRRAGARRVTLVAPYLSYMRQDSMFRPGEPISQRVIGRLLAESFERIVTVEPHLHRTRSLREVLGSGARAVSAAPALAAWIGRGRGRPLLVGPDEESRPWVQAIARRARLEWRIGRKRRLGDRRVQLELDPLPPATRAVIVDDIVSSGATLGVTARALRARGIRTIDVCVVHAIFAPGAYERLRRAGVRRIASCDTIPHPTNAIRTAAWVAPALGG